MNNMEKLSFKEVEIHDEERKSCIRLPIYQESTLTGYLQISHFKGLHNPHPYQEPTHLPILAQLDNPAYNLKQANF